ncbi:YceD family protein [Pseudomarimonas salicorniae]|uniref:Large ribosomal RNA subunit accumulation protein YceD n=1 Tax=Pseudomarimonas salicorniae TaxID=2933270 RepID=A0ABT0GGJ6_9GAMM|nr:YceD family protein [Lysobacter sp. CAU 1642]MCK7593563.1 YceD family protein [Lysobacter sp. CAU 1642]
MSVDLPDSLDAWRAVSARRIFEGSVALSRFGRLQDSLADSVGECRFRLEFDRDNFGLATVEVEADAELPLVCQRSLQRFLMPVSIRQRLGLVRSEAEESALPPEVEPVLIGADGELSPLALIEDELILALPVVPLGPQAESDPEPQAPDDDEPRVNPFAALAALKKQTS